MNQEDPRANLWTFLVGSPNRIQLPSLSNINDSRHISQKKKNTPHLSNIHDLKKNTPTPVKHPQSQKKIPYTCQTFVISKNKNTPHLSDIRDLKKKYSTPNKHRRSQKIKIPHT